MLSNHLIGNYKLVLIIDHIGIERNSKTILEKLLSEQNQSYEIYNESNEIITKINIIITSIAQLELKYTEKEVFHQLQRLKTNDNVQQIFAWISSKNIQSKILIPFLEYMSNVICTIDTAQHLTIVTKSKSGVVKFKEYSHELTNGNTTVKEYKKENNQQVVAQDATEDIENLGTFKIGQKADELEAKKNLKLPFEKIDLPTSTPSKIIYTPDSVDDFDEEDDPDNDLQF